YEEFAAHLASNDGVPKDEAQNVFLLVLNSAREDVLGRIKDQGKMSESMLDSLCEFSHLNPSQMHTLCEIFNRNGTLTENDYMTHIGGTNPNYVENWTRRAKVRAKLALYGEYRAPHTTGQPKYKFLSSTPWTDFCNGAASSTLYELEK
ncbi:MAG: hypothetical protein ACI4UE_02895, partial [Candidatus Scatovivens sp.]